MTSDKTADQLRQELKDLDEELAELDAAVAARDDAAIRAEMGDLLFTIANWCRHLQVDPESCLRSASHKFATWFRAVEQDVTRDGREWQSYSAAELDSLLIEVSVLTPERPASAGEIEVGRHGLIVEGGGRRGKRWMVIQGTRGRRRGQRFSRTSVRGEAAARILHGRNPDHPTFQLHPYHNVTDRAMSVSQSPSAWPPTNSERRDSSETLRS